MIDNQQYDTAQMMHVLIVGKTAPVVCDVLDIRRFPELRFYAGGGCHRSHALHGGRSIFAIDRAA